MMPHPRRKGTFGALDLPLSKRYLTAARRNLLLLVGTGLAALTAAIFLVSVMSGRGQLLSSGPLTSAHASLESNCASCHTPGGKVADSKCGVCHEKFTTGIAAHSFDAHYIYESGDHRRAFVRGNEQSCASCHTEHSGRRALLTAVEPKQCRACHAFSFEAHPEFAFAARSLPDDAGLAFTHVKHVERVMDRDRLDNVETSCLKCHTATGDGKRFEPINFDRSCSTCHLGAAARSEALDVKSATRDIVTIQDGRAQLALGVEGIETIRRRQGPGEAWAMAVSPSQFDVADGQITKVGIDHADPWIMHNLRLLRRAIYPDDSIADLLRTSGTLRSGGARRDLYEEALATLRQYANGLRGQGSADVQDELLEIDRQIADLERQVRSSDTALSDNRFRSDLPSPALSSDQLQEINEFAATVARPCAVCHQVESATIGRVQKDQRTLVRAVFNHSAHVLQRDCLSCHTAIAVTANLGIKGPLDPAIDNASIQNLPRIAQCQACHTPRLASNSCSTCHNFHPGRSVK